MGKTNEPLASFEDMERACKNAYSNALLQGFDLNRIAAYMFMEGIRFERTRQIPKSDFDKDTNF